SDAKANKPRVVIERPHDGNNETTPRGGAARQRRDNARHMPSGCVPVLTIRPVQVLEVQRPLPDNPIVRDQDSRDRTQAAGIAEVAGGSFTGREGKPPPRVKGGSGPPR